MSFIDQTPGDIQREQRKAELAEKGIKDAGTAVAVVRSLMDAFEAQREHVDELITEAFIKKESPTDVVLSILSMTIAGRSDIQTGGTP